MTIIQAYKNDVRIFKERDDKYGTFELISCLGKKLAGDNKILSFMKRHGLRRRSSWVQHNWGREAILRKY